MINHELQTGCFLRAFETFMVSRTPLGGIKAKLTPELIQILIKFYVIPNIKKSLHF